MVVQRTMHYGTIEAFIRGLKLSKLQDLSLFDIFQSEKIGADKKSLAIHFTFMDAEKTLTDKEIDGWMNRIMTGLEKELGVEIRK
jgi:phenylalanyl-tRNA synthetase beta chain